MPCDCSRPRRALRLLVFVAVLLMTLALSAAALAAEAMDITEDCKFKTSGTKYKYTQMTDKKYTSKWESNKTKAPNIQITATKAMPIKYLYVCFASIPEAWEVQVADGNDWITAIPGDTRFLHTLVTLPEPAEKVRLIVRSEKQSVLAINELFVLGEGELPDWVQVWEPTCEKADILFLSTHPDDELIFFAGAIPTYAAEQQRDVVVAYFTKSNTTRSSELLNGLWSMGVRNYPVIGPFGDTYSKSLSAAYKAAGGQEKVRSWIVELYRKYRPEVVVTQDKDGEYGHYQHRMIAEAAQDCIELANTEGEFLDSFLTYGNWQVKKLYLHLWPENQIVFDWNVPLESMGGMTGLELADRAYTTYHITQRTSGMSVVETGTEYDNRVFGLAYTAVGEDVRKDDFLENIYDKPGSYVPAPATPAPTPAPTPVPAYVSKTPALNEAGFLDEGEFIYSSEDEGLWIFINQTCRIIIERKYDASMPLTWFEAEIWSDVEAGELLRTIQNDPEKMGKVRADAQETAKKHQVVFAMNTDYYTYRIGGPRKIGVVIRDGKILYDDRYTEEQANNAYLFPNLDSLAFYPDGRLEVYRSYEKSAQEYVDEGAYAVYSFGPYLMKDGALSAKAYTSSDSKNPRCALGMVEPGHYVAILAEGRLKRSGGITVGYLAKMMREKGCVNAFNLDGGQTAVMVFMGKQLNLIGKYDGKTNSRPTSEVLGIGTSDQVGVYEVK